MVTFPPCKINLGLNILRKRPDGYHDIKTCFYPVPFTDVLEIIPAKEVAFSSSGLAIPGSSSDNLCLKAYQILSNSFDLPPVKIHLHKVIPTGAGLGGGSSDAAWTLRMLREKFQLPVSDAQLRDYAARLGSDCAFFIGDSPMMGSGRGEILSPVELDLRGKFMVLVNPGLHVSTADAYSGVVPSTPKYDLAEVLKQPVQQWNGLLHNDFEESVFRRFPLIKEIKDYFYNTGAVYAAMSGSGSSVFGLFSSPVELQESAYAKYLLWKGPL